MSASISDDETRDALSSLMVDVFWHLVDLISPYPSISAVGSAEMENLDGLVRAVVDILHAHCVADISTTMVMVNHTLIKFLTCEVSDQCLFVIFVLTLFFL